MWQAGEDVSIGIQPASRLRPVADSGRESSAPRVTGRAAGAVTGNGWDPSQILDAGDTRKQSYCNRCQPPKPGKA